MKKNEVKINGYYTAKVSDKLTIVRIIDENPHGGWDAVNTKTGKKVRINSPARLRAEVTSDGKPVKREPKALKPKAAPAKADATPVAPTCEPAAEASQTTTEEPERDTPQPVATGGEAEEPAEEPTNSKHAASTGKKLSLVEAAILVMKEIGEPMNTKRMLALVTERALWSSPNGKTPHNTLYAAILREIREKGSASRFEKVERGKFALKNQS